MVDVALTLVNSTMHEKSCMYLHNVRKFEIEIQRSVI